MTLFAKATNDSNIFEDALQKFYQGQYDKLTLEYLSLLNNPGKTPLGWERIYYRVYQENTMSLQKKWIEKQKNSKYLWLDAVVDFLELHGLGDMANEIRTPLDSSLNEIPTKTKYGEDGQTVKKGLLILLLQQHNLWTIYAEQYWPNRKCWRVKLYLKKAAEWKQK